MMELERPNRREFLRGATAGLAGSVLASGALWLGSSCAHAGNAEKYAGKPALRVGLVTDLHYADKNDSGSRCYRDSLKKIRPAVDAFNKRKVDLAVELGDLVDAASTVEKEISFLHRIEKEYARVKAERHYVLGNHCVTTLKKSEFLANCGTRREAKEAHYSFDKGPFHFVVLDACFRGDGVPYGRKNFRWDDAEIPAKQRQWLRSDLDEAEKPTIIFVHQRLDVKNHYAVKSAVAVREILEKSDKVLAVFQGHNHVNEHRMIGGVHYVTLAAMIEEPFSGKNNAYSVLECYENGVLKVDGFKKQKDWTLGVL